MGRPSKFTPEAKTRILEALQVGASRNVAAAIAQVHGATLKRWLDEGKDASESSPYAKFRAEVLEAEAHPKMRALGVIYQAMEHRPDLAWKFIERRVDGYEAPVAQQQAVSAGPVNIMLSFTETARPAMTEVIDVGPAEQASSEQPALPARATPKPARRSRKSG